MQQDGERVATKASRGVAQTPAPCGGTKYPYRDLYPTRSPSYFPTYLKGLGLHFLCSWVAADRLRRIKAVDCGNVVHS